MTSTLADVALTGAWVNLVSTHASLGSADAVLQNAGRDPIAVVFGGADPTALGKSGIVLGPRERVSGNASAVWARSLASDGTVAVLLGAAAAMTSGEFLAGLRSTGTHSFVNSAASSTAILAANVNRKGARIRNTDANALYLDLSGGTATIAAQSHVKLVTDEAFDVPFGLTNAITGIWAADGSGGAAVLEAA